MCVCVCVSSVNCAVMQKCGAGLHTANSCYWDTAMDGKHLLCYLSFSLLGRETGDIFE